MVSKANRLRYVTGDLPVRAIAKDASPVQNAFSDIARRSVSFIYERLRLETRFRFRALKAPRDETWSLNYRPRGIRQTFPVNSISTPVRTRETFPRHLAPLPSPLHPSHSTSERTATSRTAVSIPPRREAATIVKIISV